MYKEKLYVYAEEPLYKSNSGLTKQVASDNGKQDDFESMVHGDVPNFKNSVR